MKYSEEFKESVHNLRRQGISHQGIADILGISKSSVEHILNYEKRKSMYDKKDIPVCPFCGSHKVKLSSTHNNNRGRESIIFHVNCNSCHAKGPTASYFLGRDNDIEEMKARAIELWSKYFLIVKYEPDKN